MEQAGTGTGGRQSRVLPCVNDQAAAAMIAFVVVSASDWCTCVGTRRVFVDAQAVAAIMP